MLISVQRGPTRPVAPSFVSATNTTVTMNAVSPTAFGAAIAGARWFRNGVAASVTVPFGNWTDTGLSAGVTYAYTVAAIDANGVLSPVSVSANGATLGDTTAPTTPTITASTVSSGSISIALTVASTDASGIASYALERSLNGSTGWTVVTSAATFPYVDTGLSASTTYFYRCRATDGATPANVGAYSANTSATTSAAAGGGVFTGANGFSATASTFGSLDSMTIVRAGGGLGTAPIIRVVDDFAGGTDNGLVDRAALAGTTWTGYYESNASGTPPRYRLGNRHGGTCMEGSHALYVMGMSFPDTGEVYQFYTMRKDLTGNRNVKETWFFQNWSTSTNDACMGRSTPSQQSYLFGNSFGAHYFADGALNDGLGAGWSNTGWNQREVWTRADSLVVDANGVLYVSFTNSGTAAAVESRTDVPTPGITKDGYFNQAGTGWDSISVPGYWDPVDGQTAGTLVQFGEFYLATGANAAKRFMLTDNATWANRRALYVLPHTSWSDGSAVVLLPRRASGTWTGHHVWSFDANNVRTYCGSIA